MIQTRPRARNRSGAGAKSDRFRAILSLARAPRSSAVPIRRCALTSVSTANKSFSKSAYKAENISSDDRSGQGVNQPGALPPISSSSTVAGQSSVIS